MENLFRFIKKDDHLPLMLQSIKKNVGKTFLVTNRDWRYENIVMTFLLGTSWMAFFDLVLVDANKLSFFSIGRYLKYVGPDVIYYGDHLFGDVVRCRKPVGGGP